MAPVETKTTPFGPPVVRKIQDRSAFLPVPRDALRVLVKLAQRFDNDTEIAAALCQVGLAVLAAHGDDQ